METTTATPTPRPAPRFNAWSEIAGLGVAIMEASWMVLLFQSLNEGAAATSTPAVFVYFSLVFYLAFNVFRFVQGARIKENAARGLLLGQFILLTWLGVRLLLTGGAGSDFDPFTTNLSGIGEITRLIPAWIWLLGALLWLYLRGVSAGRQGIGTFGVQRAFKFGIGMYLVYTVLSFASVRDLPGLGVFVIFMFATLLAMASARVAVLGRLRGGRRSPFSRAWFGNLFAAVAATVGIGFSAAMLATGRFALFYRQVLLNAVLAIITLTVSPFLVLIGLFAGTRIDPLPAPAEPPELPPWEDGGNVLLDFLETTGEQTQLIPPEFRIYYYLGMAMLAGLIIVAMFFGIRTMTRRRAQVEVTEYIYQPGDLLSELRKAFRRRRDELQERFFGGRLGTEQKVRAAARIRQIYADFIDLAASFGQPRDPAQTPLEFAAALAGSWPATRSEVDTITQAYLKIRYGGLPENQGEVQAVENAWRTLQSASAARVNAYEERLKQEARERRRRERES